MRTGGHGWFRVLALCAALGAATVAVPTSAEASASSSSPRTVYPKNMLSSVACATSANCWVVGNYGLNDVDYSALAEHVVKGTWKVANPVTDSSMSLLNGVTCVSAVDCWAVGASSDQTLAERWDGTSWVDAVPPDPSAFAGFDAVACPSRVDCFMVGVSYGSAMIERWADTNTGIVWVIENIASPGPHGSSLQSVACVGDSNCTAVGSFKEKSGASLPLVEKWNGAKWTLKTVPLPAGSIQGYLDSVACVSSVDCIAVGYDETRAGRDLFLSERWNGSKWSVVPAQNPAGATSAAGNSVSCPKASSCMAVGYYSNGKNNLTLAERWNGKQWKVVRTPSPPPPKWSYLYSVACSSSSSCLAVGWYYVDYVKADFSTVAITESWNGTRWTLKTAPNP